MIHKLFITILPVMVGEELLLPFLYWHQLLTTEVTHILQFVGSYLSTYENDFGSMASLIIFASFIIA